MIILGGNRLEIKMRNGYATLIVEMAIFRMVL